MDRSSKLIPSSIIEQCNSAILMLTQDNDRLTGVQTSIDSFVNDTTIKSSAFDALKNQMSNFDSAISLMMMANDADIEAYTRLSGMVGSEELIGEELFEQLEEAERSKKEAQDKIDYYNKLLTTSSSLAPSSAAVSTYNTTTLATYNQMIEADEEIIRKIKEKMELYDSIDGQSAGLFEAGAALRSQAMSVMQEISSSYISGGSYITADCETVSTSVVDKLSALGASVLARKEFGLQKAIIDNIEYNKTSFKDSKKLERDWKKKKVYFKYKSEYRYSAVCSKVEYEDKYVKANLAQSLAKLDVDSQVKVGILNEKSEFDPQLTGEIKAEASIYEAEANINVGNDKIYSKTKLEGDIGVATGNAKIDIGRDEDGSGYDIAAGADLTASVFSGEVKQKFGLFGFEVEITAEGKALGAGVEAKAGYDSGVFEMKAGATAGVGGSIGIKIGREIPDEGMFVD